MNIPCHNCPDRKLHCHDQCERYQQYKNNREVIVRNRIQFNFIDGYFNDTVKRAEKIGRQHA